MCRNHHLKHAFLPNLNIIYTFTLKKCYPFLYSLQIVNWKDCILVQFMTAIRTDQRRICCSVTKSCSPLCDPIDCSMPGFPVFPISLSFLRLMYIESVMPSNHLILILNHLIFSSCSQSFPASRSFPVSGLSSSGGQLLEFHLQHQSFQWIFRVDLGLKSL